MSDIPYDTLKEYFDKFIEVDKKALAAFVKNKNLHNYPKAFRAFKFCVKFLLYSPRNINGDEDLTISGNLTAIELTDMYEKNIPFFMALESSDIKNDDWMLLDITDTQVYLLIKSSDSNHLRRIVNELKKAKSNAAIKGNWGGTVFYKVIDAGNQNEI